MSPFWVRIEKLPPWLLLKNCNGKLDCLIYELLFIKEKKPSLNTQSDSILAKLFLTYFHLHVQTCYFCSPVYFVTLNHIYIRSIFSFCLCHLIMMSLWHRNVVLNFFGLPVFVSVYQNLIWFVHYFMIRKIMQICRLPLS